MSNLSLLEIIVGFTAVKGGKAAIDRIERVEESRRRLGEYWEVE